MNGPFLQFNQLVAFVQNVRYWYLVIASGAALAFYTVFLVGYRLFFSPIAGFPGPKLAAATEWYEFYFQLAKDGQWGNQVRRLHEQYGAIVRISPWELSIRDASFYRQIYVGSSKRRTNLWARGREGNGFQDSHHMTVAHDLHRKRREHLEGFFSKQRINEIEDTIADKVRLLDERLRAFAGTNTIVPVNQAFSALAGDLIGHVACGAHPGLTEDANFSPAWHELVKKMVWMLPVFRCFSWLNSLLQMVPVSILQRIYPKGISNMLMGEMGKKYIEDIRAGIREGKLSAKDREKSIFHYLLMGDIPESERSLSRLQAESMVILLAGTFTTSLTLTMIMYHVLSEPRIEKRLREELNEVMACYPTRNPRWVDLEQIPYLEGCIKEGLRLYSIVGNLPRCSPDAAIQYKDWTIPPNTPVGISINYVTTDPSVFHEPLTFLPERWLGEYDPTMDRNFVPFTLGSRNCLGMNLALAELYLAVGILFRPGGPKLSLYETDESDVRLVRDYVVGFPKPSSKGVRVMVN
ncbi:hypothetical protein BBP40_003341 [Aspergillus hancockii]|nr:hypothetical protein BBP40_003341 [Aspergillus hancockii]